MQAGGWGRGDSGASGSPTSGRSPHPQRISDRTGKAESPRARGSRARPTCAHRTLTAPLPAKQESPHFSEEPAEISESENQLITDYRNPGVWAGAAQRPTASLEGAP